MPAEPALPRPAPPDAAAAAPAAPPSPPPGTWAAFRGRKYLTELDGLRTLAICAVVWNHAGDGTGNFGWGLGVKLFFVISGFLITTLLLRERDKKGEIALGDFYLRRSFRIFPLYFGVLALYAVLVALREGGTPTGRDFFSHLPWYLTFTANWFVDFEVGTRVIFYFAWSLSAQEQFYTVWPAVVRYTRRPWVPAAAMAAALLVSEVVSRAVQAGALHDTVLAVRIWERFPVSIGLGFLAAYAVHHERSFGLVRWLVASRWSALAGLALMLVQGFRPATPPIVPSVGALLLVLACATRPDNALAPFLRLRLVRHVGVVSLGIYLLHMLALHAVRMVIPEASRAVTFLLGLPLAVLAASASYRWFEQPIMGLKARFAPARPALGARPAPKLAE